MDALAFYTSWQIHAVFCYNPFYHMSEGCRRHLQKLLNSRSDMPLVLEAVLQNFAFSWRNMYFGVLLRSSSLVLLI